MTRISLALAFVLMVSLTLPPGLAWANEARSTGSGHGPHSIGHERDARPFVGPGQHGVGQERDSRPHELNSLPSSIHRRTGHPFGSTVIGVPRWVWVPGFWWWDDFEWVWVPGYWAFAGRTLFFRNPCD